MTVRIITFLKILGVLLLATLLTIVVIQNNTIVTVRLPFTQPVQWGFLYVLLGTFISGILATLSITFMLNVRNKRKRELLEAEEEESDELVEED